MSNTSIKIENVSKLYRLGKIGTGSFKHDVNRWWHTVRGKEDPYMRLGEENDRTTKGNSDYVWALKDISFDVQRGDVLGIIGKNGAGKSTLLKLLSRTTLPTKGSIKIKGRIASLLEVGTGFHPELTGRENIFLNGAILGMTKFEIKQKFDEIVDFSGVEKYIDTPVKRYSSGMYVRLAFAVAAHLEPEILIVDEVLAVGDAEFQKKAIGKMQDVSSQEGRTVLFVSHSMPAIRQLCTRGFVMKNGIITFQGNPDEAVQNYIVQNTNSNLTPHYTKNDIQKTSIEIIRAEVMNAELQNKSHFNADEDIYILLKFVKNENVPGILGYLVVRSELDEVYIESDTYDFLPNILDELEVGEHDLLLKIPKRVLPKGTFKFYLNFQSQFSFKGLTLDSPRDILKFEVYDTTSSRGPRRKAYTNTIVEWKKIS
jgi:lipopolysaccharide transport system ATP-binding protein